MSGCLFHCEWNNFACMGLINLGSCMIISQGLVGALPAGEDLGGGGSCPLI